MSERIYYVYIFLDPRKPGHWEYGQHKFNFQPFYVGKGKDSRMEDHMKNYTLKKNDFKSRIIKKIQESGLEPIRLKLFEGLTDDESQKIEIDIISHFGRINMKTGILVNMTRGGDGADPALLSKKVYQYSLDGDFIRSFDSVREAMAQTNSPNIHRCADGRNRHSGGYQWTYEDRGLKISKVRESRQNHGSTGRSIIRLDLNLNVVETYPSIRSAKEAISETVLYGVNSPLITGQPHNGFYWKYADGEMKSSARTYKTIYHYNRNGDYLGSYNGVRDAFEKTKLPNIRGFLRRKTSKGNTKDVGDFRFFNEFLGDKIEPYQPPIRTFKKVSCWSRDGDLVQSFNSIKEASQFLGTGSQQELHSVRKGIKEGTEQRGYFWKLEDSKT